MYVYSNVLHKDQICVSGNKEHWFLFIMWPIRTACLKEVTFYTQARLNGKPCQLIGGRFVTHSKLNG